MESIKTGTIKNLSAEEDTYQIVYDCDHKVLLNYDISSKIFYMDLLDTLKNDYNDEDRNKIISGLMTEDSHWDWFQKSYYIQKDPGYKIFCLVINAEVQATCIIYQPKKSCAHGDDIFYIEYISVAPWNRKNDILSRKYKGLATILITNILQYGIDTLKLVPGFSLHSLDQATGYYERLGMHKYSNWDKESMTYYELSCENAMKLLKEEA